MQDVLCFDITAPKESVLQHEFIPKLYALSLVKHAGGGEDSKLLETPIKYRKLLLSLLSNKCKLLRLSRWGNRK